MDDLADVVSGAVGAPQSSGGMVVNISGVGSKGDTSKYDDQFAQAGQQYGIDPAVLRGVARTESSFNPNAVSHDENGKPLAHGLMQLTMPTAHALGVSDPYDPSQAIPAAAKLLRQNMDSSGGDVTKALMMYHGGTDTANWGPKTQAYPGKVLGTSAKPAAAPTDPSEFNADDVIAALSGKATQTAQPGSTFQLPPASQQQQAASQPQSSGIDHAGAAQGQRIFGLGSQLAQEAQTNPNSAFLGTYLANPEAALNMGSGLVSSAAGGLAGLGSIVKSGVENQMTKGLHIPTMDEFNAATDRAANLSSSIQNAGTYQPRFTGGKLVSELASVPMNAASQGLRSIGGDTGQFLGGDRGRMAGEEIGGALPAVAGTLAGGASMLAKTGTAAARMPGRGPMALANRIEPTMGGVTPEMMSKPRIKLNADGSQSPLSAPVPAAAPAGVTPEMMSKPKPTPNGEIQQVIDQNAGRPVNQTAVDRHAEASSLPHPVDLTEGQATGDVNLLSHEQNIKGQQPALAQRFNAQNGELVKNVNAIRDAAAPDVTAVNHVENGQALIDSYKAKDAALNSDISAKYQALKDANGGQFPLDGKALVDNTDAALHNELLFHDVPASMRATLEDLRNGGDMSFEKFESMRTNLARIQRSPTADGNVKAAAGIIRDQMEALPMPEGAEHLKPLANAARGAAKSRFNVLEQDPAYKAAVNDTTVPDDFVNKYVINGKVDKVKAMRDNLADDPLAAQSMASGTVNFLKSRAGLVGDTGNFSQAGYNKALQAVSPKLEHLMPAEQAQQLQTLGNVARYTQEQPRGSYVNNSNTLVGYLGSTARNIASGVANAKTGGVSGVVGSILENRRTAKQVEKALAPGAGIKISDFNFPATSNAASQGVMVPISAFANQFGSSQADAKSGARK